LASCIRLKNEGQVFNQKLQRNSLAALAEKQGENEFNNLPIEEKQAILKAEQELRNQANASETKKYIFIGVGLVALVGIIYIIRKNK
jgi:hypothetical protein